MEKLSVISSESVISSDLQQVKAEFQSWRSQKVHSTVAIPEYLWDKAFSLLKTYPLTVVRRELGLNRERLLAYLQSTQLSQLNSSLQPNTNSQPTFLQITHSDLNILADTSPSPNSSPNSSPSPSPSPSSSSSPSPSLSPSPSSSLSPSPSLATNILAQSEENCRIVIEKSDGSRLSLQLSTNFSTLQAMINTFLKG